MSEAQPEGGRPKLAGLPEIDTNEYGGKKDGVRQAMDRRLFMQLQVFDLASAPPGTPHSDHPDTLATKLSNLLRERGQGHVVYADATSPRGIGLLTWSEDPAAFVTAVRSVLLEEPFKVFHQRHEFSMFGRTYAIGHEPELEHALLQRPVEYVTRAEWGWHVWYPLRRTGAFARLTPEEHGTILREHASIGFAYGQRELAHDVRLACHGLDAADNEFVIGLVGPNLHPLSHLVQTMRKTRQTSEFIAKMGPFFVGRVLSSWSAT